MLTVGGGGELTAGSETVGHEPLEEDWVEVCTTEVDSSGVSSRAGANDHLNRKSNQYRPQSSPRKGALTTFECIFELWGTALTGAILLGLEGVCTCVVYCAAAPVRGIALKRALNDEDLSVEDVRWILYALEMQSRMSFAHLVKRFSRWGHVPSLSPQIASRVLHSELEDWWTPLSSYNLLPRVGHSSTCSRTGYEAYSHGLMVAGTQERMKAKLAIATG